MKLLEEFFEFRTYRNSLFVVAMDKDRLSSLFASIRRYLAILDVQSDKSLAEITTKESREGLKKKLKEARREITSNILTAYRHLAFLDVDGLKWKDMGIIVPEATVKISERVKRYLKDQEKVLSRITPKYIVEKVLGTEGEKTLQEIHELFLKTPGLPILESEHVLINAVKEGVKSGILGIKKAQEVYYRRDVELRSDSIVLRGEIAEKNLGREENGS